MIPHGKSQAMKLVVPKGGGPFHDRCMKEEGVRVIDKTIWDERFMLTWTLKAASKRSVVQKSRMNEHHLHHNAQNQEREAQNQQNAASNHQDEGVRDIVPFAEECPQSMMAAESGT
jgi:hypothetical protein